MGKIWLHDWPDAIRDYKVKVDFWPGWELASRSSGGLEAVLGLGIHHDGAPPEASTINRHRYAWNTAPARPIGNGAMKKGGGITIGAAGATNTQGASETGFWVSKGFIPKSQGNLYMIALEAENNGSGEVWDDKQLEDYEAVMAATCDCYNLDPLLDIFTHHRYTSRKVDPRGPTPARPLWGGLQGTVKEWDDISVGYSVAQRQLLHAQPHIPVYQGVPDMFKPIHPKRNSDTRIWPGPIPAGQVTEFGLDPAIFPANTIAIAMNVTGVDGPPGAYLTVWGSGPAPDTSVLNFLSGDVANGYYTGPVLNRKFLLRASHKMNIICDITGYWTP